MFYIEVVNLRKTAPGNNTVMLFGVISASAADKNFKPLTA